MDIGSIFLILGLLIIVSLYISRPFFERKAVMVSPEEQELSALLAERDRMLNALQELDFDYALGKVPEADYPAQRTAMLQRGADILRQLDAYQTEAPSENAEARLEAAIASRRADARSLSSTSSNGNGTKTAPGLAVAAADDDLEILLANRRRARSEKSAGFCPRCGGPVQKSDRFCPKCGVTLI
jgi:hypothetical protein